MESVIAKHTAGAPSGTKTAWREAADSWRLPYWDWASQNTTRFPAIARNPKIEIDTPAYPSKSYCNPMYKFVMPKSEKMGDHGVPAVNGGTDVGWVPVSLLSLSAAYAYLDI